MKNLTDEECNDFRKLQCSFNDMLRATYEAGYKESKDDLVAALIAVQESYCLLIGSFQETDSMKRARTLVGQALSNATSR